ncbi:MAG: hypothetical protein IPQ28_07595 [Sphingobacteriales bacterium]|nr:hypothetical protein [Sphingobacteriales bacterium]
MKYYKIRRFATRLKLYEEHADKAGKQLQNACRLGKMPKPNGGVLIPNCCVLTNKPKPNGK